MGESLMGGRRSFTREFKTAAVKELEMDKPVGLVARRLEVNVSLLYRWREEYGGKTTKAVWGAGNKIVGGNREAELGRKGGPLHLEIDFLKNSCGLSRNNGGPTVAADRI